MRIKRLAHFPSLLDVIYHFLKMQIKLMRILQYLALEIRVDCYHRKRRCPLCKRLSATPSQLVIKRKIEIAKIEREFNCHFSFTTRASLCCISAFKLAFASASSFKPSNANSITAIFVSRLLRIPLAMPPPLFAV
ncbi:hypothetical protein EBBID32_18700 [Sphingobium indicum BiD32]|uniref:Uncharacterized protein n=1 Tax=Sphingobium indicum BiD32 TaxID=1301087 RepID=N1MLA3_9SPHN|nr:hypothetical protein EBBID32_18700 [Sphingobium indicum BiD32]